VTAAKTAPTARGVGRLEAAVVVRVEETTRLPAAHGFPSHRPANMRRQLLTLGLDLGAPIVLYYGLSAAGVSNLVALGVGAAVPGIGSAVKIVRERTLDQLAVIVMTTMLASIGVSFLTGDTRFILAKDGWMTGIWGVWFLVTARSRRPAAFIFTRPLLEGRRAFTDESWDSLWDRSPTFRRVWRVSTSMWGLGLMVDAAIRVAMAYTLPVAVVPGLGGALWPATFVALQVITNVYYHHAGLWTVLGAPWAARSARSPRS
jgi:hypothetical protein